MGLFVGSTPVKQVHVGSTPVTAVYVGAEKIWPTIEVHEVSLTDAQGNGTVHPLLTVTVPAGETWSVRIQGTVTRSGFFPPNFRIGGVLSGTYGEGATVDFAGTVTAADSTIAMVTNRSDSRGLASFVGTVTIEK